MSASLLSTPVAFKDHAMQSDVSAKPATMNVARKMLCKPVSYDSVQNIAYSKHFATEQVIISLRLLCLSSDLPVIYHWLPWEYTRHLKKEAHVGHLQEIYSRIASSGTSQSFMVLNNSSTLAQADVYQASADDISLQYNVIPGDYRLQFLIKPERLLGNSHSLCAIHAILEFMFTFVEVSRIVMLLDEHEFLNSKIEKAGFCFHTKTGSRQKMSRLYICTRESYQRSAGQA